MPTPDLLRLIAVAAVLCGGCSANPQRMVATPATASAPDSLRAQVAIDTVTGGKNISLTSDMAEVGSDGLREALRLSLQQAGYLSPSPGNAPILLRAGIVDVEKPHGAALRISVITIIRYALVTRDGSKLLFDGLVTASCTRTVGDDLVGGVRLQHAEECAVRNNIAAFLAQLGAREPGPAIVT